jgi:hypothetical protein
MFMFPKSQFSIAIYLRESSIDIVTDFGLVLFSTRARDVLCSTALRPALGPNQWVPWALSPGPKRSGHETGHSPLLTAEVKDDRASIHPTSSRPNA